MNQSSRRVIDLNSSKCSLEIRHCQSPNAVTTAALAKQIRRTHATSTRRTLKENGLLASMAKINAPPAPNTRAKAGAPERVMPMMAINAKLKALNRLRFKLANA